MQECLLYQFYGHILNLEDTEITMDAKLFSLLSVLTSVYYYQPAIFHFGLKQQLLGLIFDSLSLEKLYHGLGNEEILSHFQRVHHFLQLKLPAEVLKYYLLFNLYLQKCDIIAQNYQSTAKFINGILL